MSRKLARVSGFRVGPLLILLTILAGAAMVRAQQTPEQSSPHKSSWGPQSATKQQRNPQSSSQQSNSQQSGSQEASPEEIGPVRKPKVKDYKNWTFNVGGGASLTNGATGNFVRGGGG